MNSHRFGLLKDSLQRVNQVLVVLVALKDFKCGEDELVLVLNQLLEELDVIWVSEVVAGKAVDVVDQLLLALWEGTCRSLQISS